MKQKVTRIGLILLVFAVWGAVIARAFVRPTAIETPIVSGPASPAPLTAEEPEPIAFTLSRDPFLGHVDRPQRKVVEQAPRTNTPPRQTRPAPPPAATKNTVVIDYIGYIRNASANGTTCVILSIGGKEHVVGVGKTIQGVVVKEATAQELILVRDGVEERLERKK